MAVLENDKHELFCQEYAKDLNASAAYVRCGYSEKTAAQSASRLLTNVNIRARIEEIRKPIMEKLNLDQEWVLNRLVQISDRSLQAEEVMKFDPIEKCMIGTGEYLFDSGGANRATELIGKHLGMFKDKIEFEDKTQPDFSKLSNEEKLQYLAMQKKLRS